MKIVIFDTETTGLIPKDFQNLDECPYMLQLGSIMYDTTNNQIINTINDIVKIPDNVVIPEESIKIHNITRERIKKEGVNIQEILTKFNEQIKDCDLVVAHNLEYDLNIINYEYMRNNVDFKYFNMKKNSTYCTMLEGTKLCKIKKTNSRGNYFKWPKLEELHKHIFGENLIDLHDAYNDLVICLRCFMFMNFKLDIIDTNEDLKHIINKLICKEQINDTAYAN